MTLVPNTEFAHLASDEDIATVVAALTAKGIAAEVFEERAEACSRVLDLLPQGAEVYTALSIGSVHAITHQGQVLIASATGSQLAGYAFGANHIIWVVGAQKIVRNVDEGLRRIWEYSYPLENERMQTLYGVDSFPNKILLVQGELPGRISVLLVKEAVGF